ncbi:uncharacterized protein BDZ99DRAFT_461241 [Mytilinidion resinicola]|uniref:Uncharacterized protein n=1 Tax=Mytilinidion resinicola TaxID=574789 RepID=A0A6A6YUY8_9PEZI|nr:uncharacterized protein BDZ99DRAFT_461241 [Mytilinidion resinicola]KAF2812580.1 hypothetical protein BDZ99DRAFT_461241 [Mytilinidion resinicola]
MSNVNTRMVFDVLEEARASRGWGMSLYNTSLAKNVSAVADQLVQADLAMFLSERSRSVDITPMKLRSIPCSHFPGTPNTQNCRRAYFVPGGVELAAAPTDNESNHNKTDVILARSQRGYIFDFIEGPAMNEEWHFEADTDCEVYGFPFGAFHLCLKNPANNTLNARIVHCPNDISTLSDCHTNKTWHSRPGWTTSLTTTFRDADVAYSKINGTILSHTFTSPALVAPVSASEMLAGYRSAFSSFPDLAALLNLFADSKATNLFSLYVYPAMIWANLKSVEALGPQNPAVVTRAQDTLQCLLAIMLFYCQPSLFARALAQYAENATLGDAFPTLKVFAEELIHESPADTEVVEAVTRYQLQVGRATLVAYVVICGTALGACLVALGWAAWVEGTGKVRVPETTPFPAWDERVRCRVESVRDGSGVEDGEVMGLEKGIDGGKGLSRTAEGLKVVLVKEGAGQGVEEKRSA